jgi:phage tail P2-like protein
MLTLNQCSLADYFNPAVKNDQAFVAIAAALDPALQSFVSQIQACIVLSNLQNQPTNVLDVLAIFHFNVDYYDTTLPIATKLMLIQNVILDKINKGTPQRIIDLMNQVFQFAELIEWFNDTPVGAPYTFRIQIADPLTNNATVLNLNRAILIAKNVRSLFLGFSSFTSGIIADKIAMAVGEIDYTVIRV